MRFHDTDLLDALLRDVCLDFLEETEDIAAAEPLAMEFALGRLATAFGEALTDFGRGLDAEVPGTWRVKERVARQPLAEFGRISYEQAVYIDEAGDRRHYLDEVVGMPPRVRVTPNAAAMMVENACSTSYANAADLVARHCRERVDESTVAAMVAECGAAIRERREKAAGELFELGVDPGGTAGSGELFCEADGVWVSTVKRGWSGGPRRAEVKNFVAYTGKSGGRLDNRVCNAAVEKPASFWRQSIAAAGEVISLSGLESVSLGVDGASWCRAGRSFLPGEAHVYLDKWHLYHNIDAAFADKREASAACGIVRDLGPEALLAWLELRHGGDEKAAELGRYVANNADIIDASASLGSIEGENAHVVSDRMEAWGCAWSLVGADAMARCRAERANGRRLPRRSRDAFLPDGHWERLAKRIGRRVRYDKPSVGEGYEYPHKVETKKMPSRQEYLLNRRESSYIPY